MTLVANVKNIVNKNMGDAWTRQINWVAFVLISMFNWLHGKNLSSRKQRQKLIFRRFRLLWSCRLGGHRHRRFWEEEHFQFINFGLARLLWCTCSRSSFWCPRGHLDTACHASRACTTLQRTLLWCHRQINFFVGVRLHALRRGIDPRILPRKLCWSA